MRGALKALSRLALFAATLPAFACSAAPMPTFVAYLVDFSQSFVPLTRSDGEALRVVADRIVSDATNAFLGDEPISFVWSGITSFSINESPPCGSLISYQPRMIGKTKPGYIHKQNDLRAWHEACVLRLLAGSFQSSQWTDISGALASIGETSHRLPGPKVLVILSDFKEDQPQHAVSLPFRLNEHRVIMLFRPARDALLDQSLIERVEVWEKRFRESGASGVCRAQVGKVAPGLLAPCLKFE